MVNAPFPLQRLAPILGLAIAVLASAAWLRSAEYDEQYSLFLTGSVVRPVWPDAPFPAATIHNLQAPAAGPWDIALALRHTDVHPPLYFWALGAWRRLAGDSLATARLLSVACAVATLAQVARLATRTGTPPALAALLTLGCYGFVYTGAIARGFALAQMLLTGGAVLLLATRRPRGTSLAAGLCLGAATAANYLAVFPALGLLAGWSGPGRWRHVAWAMAAMLPWLILDAWFFVAQRGARPDQFPPFTLLSSIVRVARYAVANLVGGLPLYMPPAWQMPMAAALSLFVLALVGLLLTWHARVPTPPAVRALALAALAPAAGLLALGAVFDTTPIELRYLSFALPMAMPLLAGALSGSVRQGDGPLLFAGARRRRWRWPVLGMLLGVQGLAVVGLLTRPETMQPARRVAAAATELAAGAPVLLPAGNDGVGIIGAFGQEAPPDLRLIAVRADETPLQIRARVADQGKVVVAGITQDSASRAAVTAMQAAFADPCWQVSAARDGAVSYRRTCPMPQP